MKKIIVLFAVAAMAMMSGSKVSAQGKYGPDSAECIKYLSYYTEYYKQKNYDNALPNWRKAYHYCPPSSRYSLLSLPSSRSVFTLNVSAILISISIDGITLSFSQLETHCFVTPRNFPSSI